MIRTNEERLPIIYVQGAVTPAWYNNTGIVGIDGLNRECCYIGGISINVKIGDPVDYWEADHIEPGVTTRDASAKPANAYIALSCIGNEVTVITGDAKGAKGFVTGKHGGADHIMVHFDRDTLEKLNDDDKFKVRSQGVGLCMVDYPSVMMHNCSPDLLGRLDVEEKGGKLHIGVAKIIPQCLVGSGVGDQTCSNTDFDIVLHDAKMVEAHGLAGMRLGDIVAITDVDARFGCTRMTGGVAIGVVAHGTSSISGHGPGIVMLMACLDGTLAPHIDAKANLADLYHIG